MAERTEKLLKNKFNQFPYVSVTHALQAVLQNEWREMQENPNSTVKNVVIGGKYISQLGIVFCFFDNHAQQVRFKPMTLNTIEVGKAKILLQKIFDQLRGEELYVRFLLLWLLNWTIYSWIKKTEQYSSKLFHILEFAAVAGDTLQNWPCPPPLQSIWTPSTILISFTETILFSFVSFVLLRTSSNV